MESKVCIPLDIIRNTKLSPRARLIWAELSLLPKGAVGEFVVKHKELSKLLGICDSTLRRAVKALEEAGLIQCVGLFDKRFKKYVFKNSSPALAGEENFSLEKLGEGSLPSVDSSEKIPLPPFSKGDLRSPSPFGFGFNSPLEKWGRGIFSGLSTFKLDSGTSPE